MRVFKATALAVLLGGCLFSPRHTEIGEQQPDAGYEYPGCVNADLECPRLYTAVCALQTIRDRHRGCTAASDFFYRCTGAGTCPPYLVNVQQSGANRAEAQDEIDRYCAAGTCSASSGNCSWVRSEHVISCESGSCVWMKRPADAGQTDAGQTDAGPPDAGPPDAGPPDAGPPADAGCRGKGCTGGLYCCNESCAICAPIGDACIKEVCP
jgi:hypothetical protein